MAANKIPKGVIIFLSLIHVVSVLGYAGFPVVMSIPVIDRWLKRPRQDVSSMSPLHALLDQGLKMFSIKMAPPSVPKELLTRISRLEARVDTLRSLNHNLSTELTYLSEKMGESRKDITSTEELELRSISESEIKTMKSNPGGLLKAISKHFSQKNLDSSAESGHLTLVVRHFVKWECALDFENWTNEIEAEMQR
jgi:hypothetical protein